MAALPNPDPAAPRQAYAPARALLLVLLLIVDGSWCAAWSIALGAWLGSQGGAPLLGIGTIAALLGGGALATRLVLPRLGVQRAQVGLAAIGLLVALVVGTAAVWASAPADWSVDWVALLLGDVGWRPFLTLALTLVVWQRGLAAGSARLSLDELEGALRRSILALAAVFVLNALAPAPSTAPASALMLAALVSLAAGLVGLPLARLLEMRAVAARAGAALRVDPAWFGMLLGAVAALLLGALALTTLLSFERIDVLLGLLAKPLDLLLWLFLTIVALPIGYLLDALVTFLRQFIQPLPPREQPPTGLALLELIRQLASGQGEPSPLLPYLRFVMAAVVVGLVIWFLARAVFRPPDEEGEDEVDEVRDFVWSWSAFRDALRLRLRSLGRRRRAPPPPAATEPSPAALDRERWGPREIYAALLRLGAQLGRRRALPETPLEFERSLASLEALAPGTSAIRTVTDLYVQDRYGASPPSSERIAEGRDAIGEIEGLVEAARVEAAHPVRPDR